VPSHSVLNPCQNTSLDELISGIVQFYDHAKKRILVIEDNEDELQTPIRLLSNDKVEVFGAATAKKHCLY